ncbi:MAG: xanthine dehydrogenase family protein subunit M [Baekduia sp.]
MKPPPFDYSVADGLEHALELLAANADEGKIIAGGQSLVPMLNFRLARPSVLIDVNGVQELSGISRSGGELRIGALTRHAAVERSPLIAGHWPLLRAAVRWVAHPQIRNRGTIGGSCCHSDPSAEMPVALTALDARFIARSAARGERELRSAEMFAGQLENGLEDDELLIAIRVPAVAPRSGHAFREFARRKGDYALGGAAVTLALAGDGTCSSASIALLGAGPVPARATAAEQVLVGSDPVTAAVDAAAAAIDGIAPTGDLHGSSDYRRHLIGVLTRRAILEAAGRAREEDA